MRQLLVLRRARRNEAVARGSVAYLLACLAHESVISDESSYCIATYLKHIGTAKSCPNVSRLDLDDSDLRRSKTRVTRSYVGL